MSFTVPYSSVILEQRNGDGYRNVKTTVYDILMDIGMLEHIFGLLNRVFPSVTYLTTLHVRSFGRDMFFPNVKTLICICTETR